MKFYGNIQNGRLMLSASQKLLRQNYLNSLKNDTHITEEIKRVIESKTHQQVKTIFGFVLAYVKSEFDDRGWDSSFILNLPEPTGNEVTINFLKEYFYLVCPIYSDDGKRITLSHKDCNKKLASDFLDGIRNFSASQWSVYIPDPDPQWREKGGK